jgi:hypothetical protein
MYAPRLCNDNIKGLDAFINLTKKDILENIAGDQFCPCIHCKNEKKYRTDDVLRSHLIRNEFMEDYRCWKNTGWKDLMKQR